MTEATTIDQVLERLDEIIARSKQENDPLGFFAYVYRRTTAQIKQAIVDGKFEDNPRMERFDVAFANKYLRAYFDYQEGRSVCGPWAIAFKVKNTRLTILQHIILGMNAHINFDLGLTASEFEENGRIDGLKNDFMLVNEVLASLVDELQVKVGRVSRLMFLLDWIGKRNDEAVMNFSMEKAREQAWNFGLSLSHADAQTRPERIAAAEEITSKIGNIVKHPPGKISAMTIKLISFFEEKDVKKIISKLEAD